MWIYFSILFFRWWSLLFDVKKLPRRNSDNLLLMMYLIESNFSFFLFPSLNVTSTSEYQTGLNWFLTGLVGVEEGCSSWSSIWVWSSPRFYIGNLSFTVSNWCQFSIIMWYHVQYSSNICVISNLISSIVKLGCS
jgi:hypothetical protein